MDNTISSPRVESGRDVTQRLYLQLTFVVKILDISNHNNGCLPNLGPQPQAGADWSVGGLLAGGCWHQLRQRECLGGRSAEGVLCLGIQVPEMQSPGMESLS